MLENWQNVYSYFNPIAFHIGSFAVHWYGLMYALALLIGIYTFHYFIKKDNIKLSKKIIDSYIIWVEIGVILGARLGYILFYSNHTLYYLSHPWNIFNPFINGKFVGIAGMSYHGATLGFIIASILFARKYKINFWFLVDRAVIAVPLAYIFGRIANFMNQELIGRTTDISWGIYVHGVLRHPSTLYEAFLEGFVVFIILYLFRFKKLIDGELALIYAISYSFMRIIAEIFRQPDVQLGFLFGTTWVTMGMLISFCFIIILILLYIYLINQNKKKV